MEEALDDEMEALLNEARAARDSRLAAVEKLRVIADQLEESGSDEDRELAESLRVLLAEADRPE